jgi:tetratricopeptide (TPR) repeat protein
MPIPMTRDTICQRALAAKGRTRAQWARSTSPGPTMNFDALRHYYRARLFQFLKQPRRAEEEYRRALEFNPDFAKAASARASLLAAQQRFSEAAPLLHAVVHRSPSNAAAWYNLGFVYDKLHDPAKAADAFRQAVELDPKLDRAWYGLGLALAGLEKHLEAAQALERAAQLEPMNGHIWYQLGMAWHAQHEADKVKGIVEHLDRFDRRMARQLVLDSGRTDLARIVSDLKA